MRRSSGWSGKRRVAKRFGFHLEQLETRALLSGTWSLLSSTIPGNVAGNMILLSDGTVLVHGGQGPQGTSAMWNKLTPDTSGSYVNGTWSPVAQMNVARLYFASDVLKDGRLLVAGGEYSSVGGDTPTGEIYDPVANTWSPIATYPVFELGDAMSETLPDGTVIAGGPSSSQTYIYNPTSNTWSTNPNLAKVRNDNNAEESWVKLPDGSILSYDISSSNASGIGHSQRFVPSSGQWVDAGNLPALLSDSTSGGELGPALLLPDGRAFFEGANGNTAFYTLGSGWSAGPAIPNGLVAADAPAAMLTNGDVLMAVAPAITNGFVGPTTLYEFNPTTDVYTNVTPSLPTFNLNEVSYATSMLALPTGQVLMSNFSGQLAVYTPSGAPQAAWKPTISGVVNNGDGTFTLTGTQLNGLSEGAAYGDDEQMASNYPIVQLVDSTGHAFDARTFNWSSTGVATGSAPETVQFTLPTGVKNSATLSVIANGIASSGFAFSEVPPNDNFANAQVVSAGTYTGTNIGATKQTGEPNIAGNAGGASVWYKYTATTTGQITFDTHGSTFDTLLGIYTGSAVSSLTLVGSSDNDAFQNTLTSNATFNVTAGTTYYVAVDGKNGSTGNIVLHTTDAPLTAGALTLPSITQEGQSISNQILFHFTDTDLVNNSGNYTAKITWGDGATSMVSGTANAAGQIVASVHGGYDVLGSHSYTEELTNQTFGVTVTPNGGAPAVSGTGTISLVDAPLYVYPQTLHVTAGAAVSNVLVATFTDADPYGTATDYTASINWGDGDTTASVSITADPNIAGQFDVTASKSHPYASAGNLTLTVTVNDAGGATAMGTIPGWSSAPILPLAVAHSAAVTGPDGRLYVFGGDDNSGTRGTINSAEAYNTSSKTWTTLANIPEPLGEESAAVGSDGRIYLIGGISFDSASAFSFYQSAVYAYTPSTNTWATVASLPTVIFDASAAEGSDGRIYLFGGQSFSAVDVNSVYAYTPASNTWVTVASMPTARDSTSAAVGPDGKIYVFGGNNASTNSLTTVQAYSPATNTWSTAPSLPAGRGDTAAVTGTDGRLYVVGGQDAGNSLQAYSTTTGTWATLPPIPTLQQYPSAALGPDGRIYLFGGSSTNGASNTVDAFALGGAIVSGAVTLSGSAFYIKLDNDGTTLDVWHNSTGTGAISQQFTLSGITQLNINGSSGGAVVVADFSSGVPIPSGGMTFTGTGSPQSNSLRIIGNATGNETVTASSTKITVNGVSINYSQIGAISFLPGTGTNVLSLNSIAFTVAAGNGPAISNDLFSSITIATGAKLVLANPNTHASRTLLDASGLTLAGTTGAWTASLDLSANDAIITGGDLATITNQILRGFAGGAWNGLGISSSAAAADSTHLTALGAIQNTNGSTFDGTNPPASAVLIKYTYYGDANLDGKVDGSDYTRIDNGFLNHLTGWYNGDFNYDGAVNGSDYTLIDNAYNRQGASLAADIAKPATVFSRSAITLPPLNYSESIGTGASIAAEIFGSDAQKFEA